MSVFLRFDLDCSFDEISRICGESPGAHHARVSRALRQLRLQIEARIQEPPGVASSQALTAAERPAADRIRKAS
jgi:hypothetical protein